MFRIVALSLILLGGCDQASRCAVLEGEAVRAEVKRDRAYPSSDDWLYYDAAAAQAWISYAALGCHGVN